MRAGGRSTLLLALFLAACDTQVVSSSATDNTWVGTITTEGNVATVVNESGSVWGGPVSLVETLSIGKATGDEPYLLGNIRDVGVTQHRIYMMDTQRQMVRVYDHVGAHLFDFGRQGEGPGEFNLPWAMGIDPGGRVIVQDRTRVNVFDLDGNFLEAWPYRGVGFPLVVALDGTAFVPWRWSDAGERLSGVVGIAPDGTEGRRLTGPIMDYEPWRLAASYGGNGMGIGVMYAPPPRLAVLPSGAVVRGIGDAYRFEIEHPGGRRTSVERRADLPAVPNAQRAWLTEYWTARMRSVQPDWSWTANPIPEHKPAFEAFFGDRYGRIWVRRIIRTDDALECDEDPLAVPEGRAPVSCWRDALGFDIFEEESGRLLGQVELPGGFERTPWPAFVEDGLLAVVEDEAGTIMVKRYRLVPLEKR